MKQSIVLYRAQEDEQNKILYLEQVRKGLSLPIKELPFKFNYDKEGSQLCAKIQQTDNYYLWRCQKNLIEREVSNMLKLMGNQKFNLIDLGAGDATKTQIIVETALKEGYKLEYIPMDISYHSNMVVLDKFTAKFPDLQMTVLTCLFEQGIKWVQKNKQENIKNVYFFVGSTICNYTLKERQQFCSMISKYLKKGDLLFVGFDIWKDPEIIVRAYLDNPYQRPFLLNSLKRLNNQLEADFDLTKFYPYSYYDPMDKYKKGMLISAENQKVTIRGQVFQFQKSEPIKISLSGKWAIQDIVKLFEEAQFKHIDSFMDDKKYVAEIALQKL